MESRETRLMTRRAFAGASAFMIVPRHVLGAPFIPPSDRINVATVGLGHQGQTVTMGIISAKGRAGLGIERFEDFIQTDASINQGNSGVPLLNSHGEVIGINSAIYAPTGTTAGIGFAIPINTAKRVADDLITRGRVRHATLGAEGRALWPRLA